MTYEEAFKTVNKILEKRSPNFFVRPEPIYDVSLWIKIQEALEKQIPKEPYREYDDEGYIKIEECPTCHTMDILIFDAEQNYCSNCGQSIKWE